MAHDQSGRYRGVYQWGDPILAEAYARALWWVLAAVCEPSSIHHVVFPDVDRDALLAAPSLIAPEGLAEVDSWCRIMKVT